MKKIIYSFIAGAIMVGFASCEPMDKDNHALEGQLVAENALSFSVAATENQNEYVYTNTSNVANDVRMFWDFADGKAVEAKAGESVTKQYKKAGSYEVKLLAFNSAGQTAVSQVTVIEKDLADDSFVWKGFGYNKDNNLAKNATFAINTWTADEGWANIAEPTRTGDTSESVALAYSAATGTQQWQAQLHLESDIVASAAKTYDYSVCIKSSVDLPEITVKICKVGDDNAIVFLSNEVVTLKAGVSTAVAGVDLPGVDGNLKFSFDFAPVPAGAEIEVSNIYLSEHDASNVAPFDYNSDANLWKAVDDNKAYTVEHWWSDTNWAQIGNPDFSAEGNVYTITAKDGTGAEWQAQNTIKPNSLPLSGSAKYDLSCIMKASVDTRVTLKVCQSDDDNNELIYKNDIQLKAGEVQAVAFSDLALSKSVDAPNSKFIIDLGGCAAGTEFKVGNITLIEK
ncbi:MAG: PKD domain-containing protein [Bacteroides sp.]|nr:PKD domain-containing protein [Bacteroides sp.]